MDVCQFTAKIVHLIYVFKVFNGRFGFFLIHHMLLFSFLFLADSN